VVEDLGAENHVIFSIEAPPVSAEAVREATEMAEADEGKLFADDQRAVFTAVLDARRPVPSGTDVELAVDHRRLHFFDRATGLAIRAGAAAPVAA
jgi:multiple sugar transport system ATP-binding protein